jgi:selenium metabolism protein YedF
MAECTLDCKGLPCPQPVLLCKKAIDADAPDTMEINVDNQAARENVARYLGTRGYKVIVEERPEGLFLLTATSGNGTEAPVMPVQTPATPADKGQKTTVFITSDCMGRGDDELGGKLMLNFLATLPELGDELWRVILVNSAVKLAVEGSEHLTKLKDIENADVTVLVCGTCLDHFGLLDQKRVGQTTNMLDVVTSLQLADKVIQV